MEELEQLAIEGKLHEKAQDDLGIYPKGWHQPDGSFKERTEWQNGWNAAVMGQTQNVIHYQQFMDTLNKEQLAAFKRLLLDDVIDPHRDSENKIHMTVNVNDLFYLACADEEEVMVEDLITVDFIYSNFKRSGVVAWVAKKRNEYKLTFKFKPNEDYYAALEWLGVKKENPSLWDKIKSLWKSNE